MSYLCGQPLRKISDVINGVKIITQKYNDGRVSQVKLEEDNACVNVFVYGMRKAVILPALTRDLKICLTNARVINELKNDGTGRTFNYTAVCLK